jgi:uridine phosphorylase
MICEKVVLVCGEDPAETERALTALGFKPRLIKTNREFHTYSIDGDGGGFTVCVTGIGSASVEISITELYKCGARIFAHTGTCGSLSGAAKPGEVALVEQALRFDGASFHYSPGAPGDAVAADPAHNSLASAALRDSGIDFIARDIISTDTFYCMGAGKDVDGKTIYPGVPLKKDFFPPPGYSAFKALLDSGKPYVIDMEAAAFLLICSAIDDEIFYVSLKGVSNSVPFEPGEQVAETGAALKAALKAATAVIARAGSRSAS